MSDPSTILKNTAVVSVGIGAAGIGYASIDRAQCVRRARGDDAGAVAGFVAAAGAAPVRSAHAPEQRRKQAWLRELARLEPDFVVNTGDNLSHPKAVPAVVQALGDLLSVPGVFVFGSNDYFGPRLKNPANYLTNPGHRLHGEPLPWQDLRAAFTERGWLDMTHTRRELEVAGLKIAAAGVDDPHLQAGPLRHHRRAAEPGRESDAGADAFARAAGAGPLRRRRIPAGDGRAHSRRPAVPAVLRRDRHQLRTGPVARQGRRRGGAPARSCTSRRASAPRRSRRCGSAAGPRPRC